MSKNIEDVLSAGRIKILKALAHATGLTANRISNQTGLNHWTVYGHLKILENTGLVTKKILGKQMLYELADNARAGKVREFILEWEDTL